MSQFEAQPVDGNPYGEPKTTSGLAVASLVCGVLGCCGGITGLIAVILGLAAVVSIRGNVQKKGTGLAAVGIVIGLITVGGWIYFGSVAYGLFKDAMALMTEGPQDAMQKASAKDYDGTRDWFFGDGTVASDEEIERFITTAETRYGAFVSCAMDESNQGQPTFGQQDMTVNYIFTFADGDVDGAALMIFADEATGQPVFKLGEIVLYDPELGDLTFPESSSGGSADADADADAEGDGEGDGDAEGSETEGQE